MKTVLTKQFPTLIMARYVYSPLNEAVSEIRLLTLLPGIRWTELCMTIEIAVLNESHVPLYEASSYNWDSAKMPVDVVVGRDRKTSL